MLLAASLLLAPSQSLAAPEATDTSTTSTSLSSAKKRAVELQKQIDDTEQELRVLKERLTIMDSQVFVQQLAAQDAQSKANAANRDYHERLVYIYKNDLHDPLMLLLSSSNFRDFYSRASMVNRMALIDRDTLAEARLANADAAYQMQVLEELRDSMKLMRAEQTKRLRDLEKTNAEQKRIVSGLTAREIASVQRTRTAASAGRKQWRESSVPLNTRVGFVQATVEPSGQTYLVPAHFATRYRSTGRVFNAHCSWYGNQFHGRTTASGQIFNQNDFTCASKTLPFGTRLALTRGDKRIIVIVNDRGPFIPGRDLDLSRGAARALGISGIGNVRAEVVTPVR
jgi:rare lipoprotein A (peptidoglycan hydrolase)